MFAIYRLLILMGIAGEVGSAFASDDDDIQRAAHWAAVSSIGIAVADRHDIGDHLPPLLGDVHEAERHYSRLIHSPLANKLSQRINNLLLKSQRTLGPEKSIKSSADAAFIVVHQMHDTDVQDWQALTAKVIRREKLPTIVLASPDHPIVDEDLLNAALAHGEIRYSAGGEILGDMWVAKAYRLAGGFSDACLSTAAAQLGDHALGQTSSPQTLALTLNLEAKICYDPDAQILTPIAFPDVLESMVEFAHRDRRPTFDGQITQIGDNHWQGKLVYPNKNTLWVNLLN